MSPYDGIAPIKWPHVTEKLISRYPLDMAELVDIVQCSWVGVLATKVGSGGFKVGTHLFPKPQIVAFFLHELIPLELSARHPDLWRGEITASDKDAVYIPDPSFSFEIKTSSHPTQIFGNRSYAQKTENGKKSKSGYYLAINFDKIELGNNNPRLRRIRFGWLDHADWLGQTASTGQQARLHPDVERGKLRLLYAD